MMDATSQIFAYHEATKHHLNRYAKSPGGLDWATQPDAFRRYTKAPLCLLEHPEPEKQPLYESVFVEGNIPVQPLDLGTLSRLFYNSLALSAWKRVGDVRWALRVNPSSGNLHPSEAYLICGVVEGLCRQPTVFHYAPKEHGLETRAEFSPGVWKDLTAGLPHGTVLIGLTSIHWREAWKYGERAFRYCQHDTGHAIGAVTLAAAALGWNATLLDDLSSDALAHLLGLSDPRGSEPEEPDCLLALYPQGQRFTRWNVSEETIRTFKTLSWKGVANLLSPAHVVWPLIVEAAAATRKPPTQTDYQKKTVADPPPVVKGAPFSFHKIVRQRRSCLALDGKKGITRDAFYPILQKVIPAQGKFPLNALPWSPTIHFGLFVHRVQDLDPGLYCLVRDPEKLDLLKECMKNEFTWEKPTACPEDLGLYRLLTGDARTLSRQIACHQEIASEGCFSLAMIAEFEEPLKKSGAWFYPRLFWEAGVIAQVLYLEAEAIGLRGTGIGCYFDDPMHDVLGLGDRRFQDLYHFTMGGFVEDTRLTTLPAYPGAIS